MKCTVFELGACDRQTDDGAQHCLIPAYRRAGSDNNEESEADRTASTEAVAVELSKSVEARLVDCNVSGRRASHSDVTCDMFSINRRPALHCTDDISAH